MAWHYEESKKRIQTHLDELTEIEVKPLTREMDLDNLTEKKCRTIYGAHVYADLPEFAQMAELPLESDAATSEYKRLIQAIHLHQIEVSHIVEKIFDAKRVHFQGIKLHALIYRPYDAESIATHAFLLHWVLNDYVLNVFNVAFPKLLDVSLRAGADIGQVIGTRNGEKSDRELLFLGSPANHAAKIMKPGALRIAARLWQELPEDLRSWCIRDDEETYHLQIPSKDTLDGILENHDIEWDREASLQRVEAGKKSNPLCDIEYSSAREKIVLDTLSIRNNKRISAVSLFADVTGFTAYIDAAENVGAQEKALRLFHLIRREMAVVVRCDYAGVRVQFQGDRVQGLFHVPMDEEKAFSLESVMAAAGLQSSLELILKDFFPEAQSLHLAIGCESGVTLASNLGSRGHRDRICLGRAVEVAAQREEALEGGQTGISKVMYELLPSVVQKLFNHDVNKKCYIAQNPNVRTLKRLFEGEQIDAGASASVQVEPCGSRVTPVVAGSTASVNATGRIITASSSYAANGE